ncbi:ATP-binding protein [Nonomuraea sp. NPDC046570]|uniref:sensor histidine kinase n=1 Tax=Nonomuraea sp. NPDC046570 TaxID=3155255 RepID=UPI0033E63862
MVLGWNVYALQCVLGALVEAARREERRRLGQDLHDSLGLALTGMGFALDAVARMLRAGEHEAALALVGEIRGQLSETAAGAQAVVRGLRPPELDRLGLTGAVREATTALSSSGVEVDVEADDTGGLDPEVETAAYWTVREALANAARHATPRSCSVRLRRSGDALAVTVSDNGRGLPARAVPGTGLSSMRERVTRLDGAFTIDTGAKGTTIAASIPLVRTAL